MNDRTTFRVLLIIGILLLSSEAPIYAWEETSEKALLLFDIHTGQVLRSERIELLRHPRPLGSLLKPLILAAAEPGSLGEPVIFSCQPSSPDTPSSASCWYRPGHGRLNQTQALALSCNNWFRAFYNTLSAGERTRLAELLGNSNISSYSFADLVTEPAASLAGFAGRMASFFNGNRRLAWQVGADGISYYPVGAMDGNETARSIITAGMQFAALEGTGAAFAGFDVLIKTGTSAWFSHNNGGSVDPLRTDGMCIVLFPAKKPRWLALVLIKDATGTEASQWLAGKWDSLTGELPR